MFKTLYVGPINVINPPLVLGPWLVWCGFRPFAGLESSANPSIVPEPEAWIGANHVHVEMEKHENEMDTDHSVCRFSGSGSLSADGVFPAYAKYRTILRTSVQYIH